MSTQIATRKGPSNPLLMKLTDYGERIVRVLPAHLQGPEAMERIIGQVSLACSLTPKLLQCDPKSVVFEVYRAARLGLDISGAGGQAYLIPFKKKASLILGYKGLVTLAVRATGARSIRGVVVHEGEEFEYSDGLAPVLRHVPTYGMDEPGKAVCAYAVATWPDGSTAWKVAPGYYLAGIRSQAIAKAGDRPTPWIDHPDEMAAKTAVRYLCKALDLSPDIVRQMTIDAKVESGTYIPENEPEWNDLSEAPPEQGRQADIAAQLTQ